MYIHEIYQWVFIFFIYSFFGWIWETSYKSIQQRKFINRGFLNGPWLPIYGFGALIILFVTLPYQENHVLVFLLGAIFASIFEFIVGYGMEKLFHARYWDYSHLPLNIKGYIALPISLVWGLFSLILVNIIDVPISRFVAQFTAPQLIVLDIILAVLFVIDVVLSTIQALDLKTILKKIELPIENQTKILTKAEKILKRNPNLLSHRHQLSEIEIKNILKELKEQMKN
ncbi:MAG: putative ABC transporter permease [Erysipelotrichaceae bacterium]|nr:putative ABC transporter permease [Erysipelotrichaceae bacterium]